LEADSGVEVHTGASPSTIVGCSCPPRKGLAQAFAGERAWELLPLKTPALAPGYLSSPLHSEGRCHTRGGLSRSYGQAHQGSVRDRVRGRSMREGTAVKIQR
jgi:hypothetical protein